MDPFVVNARFLTQNITGVQRFAIEISKELKKLYGERIRFVTPRNIIHHDLADELGAKPIGFNRGHLWEQLDLPLFLLANGAPPVINLANTAPLRYKNKVVTIHDLAFYHHPEWFSRSFAGLYNFLIPRIIKNARAIFTVSTFVRHELSQIYGIETTDITVIHNAVSSQFRYLNTKREPIVLAVGSIDPRKNLKPLIELFSQNTEHTLVVVGEKNRVFSSLKTQESSDNVIFTGYVSDDELVRLYNTASLLVYPSLYEGFGIPPLEAQSCGCPVICSDRASLPEVGGESVIYCNPDDKADMLDKIGTLLNDIRLQETLRQRGFDNIRRFGWDKSAHIMAKTLKKLSI